MQVRAYDTLLFGFSVCVNTKVGALCSGVCHETLHRIAIVMIIAALQDGTFNYSSSRRNYLSIGIKQLITVTR
jgi:hypothetical protein